jgi:hypothetical protein
MKSNRIIFEINFIYERKFVILPILSPHFVAVPRLSVEKTLQVKFFVTLTSKY